MSPRQAQQDLAAIPLPYSVFIDPRPSERVLIEGTYVPFPERYRTVAVRGIRGLINSDDRFILRFTRDFTLRNEIRHGEPHGTARNWINWGEESNIYNNPKQADIDLKTLHREWMMFRENQINSVPFDLWVKLTEAVVGNKLGDPATRVPALAAELYDQQFGTQESIGLQDGQAFVARETGLTTILNDLNDPNNDFKPVDVETFLLTHSFDTPENIEKSMIDMYNTFDNVSVNRIFFKCLQDAFTFQDKYQGLFKTSMVSINGVRILETNGVFDD